MARLRGNFSLNLNNCEVLDGGHSISFFGGGGTTSQMETLNPLPIQVEMYGGSSDEKDSDPNQFQMDSKFLGEFEDTLGLAYENENQSQVKMSAHGYPFESGMKDASDF